MSNVPEGWVETTLGEVASINPREPMKKGTIAKCVAMEKLPAFDKRITGFELKPFKGGTKFRNGDTLLARITPCLENGKTAYVDILDEGEVGFGSTEYIVIREKEALSDKQFLFYLATSPRFREIAIKCMTGTSGRQRVQTDVLINKPLFLPPLPEQKAVADMLSSFDEKIELLREQNKTLETLAQTIFKAWFCEFEFPQAHPSPDLSQRERGYKSSGGEMVEFELGLIPKGWRVGGLLEVFELIGGGTPKTSVDEYWNGDIPWYSVVDAPKGYDTFVIDTEKKISVLGLEKSSTKLLRKGTTIVSARGTVGKLALVGRETAMNQSCYGIQGKDYFGDYYVYYQVKQALDDLKRNVHGAVFDTITQATFKHIEVPIPDMDMTGNFERFVEPIMDKILNNVFQIQTLSKTRDTLLPKLMSGQIRVKF